jgi:diacylglycerol kinase family enzyme
MKKVLFVNAGAGRAKRGKELEILLAAARKQPDLQVHYINKDVDLSQVIRTLLKQGVKVVGAAGGDGTINSVAGNLVKTNVPLVVIPFGTLNHFARDIGVPPDLEQAMSLFEDGATEIRIDVGEVNGNYFLNNSSIGIYPRLVRQRERYEKKLGKWFAYLLAAWMVLRRPNLWHIKLLLNGEVQDLKVGLVFFSNNRVNMSPLGAGQRARLDDQVFDTYLVKASSPIQLFRVAASFLLNKLAESPLVTQTEVCKATVYSSRRHLSVAFDGETRTLTSPLAYQIHPAALLVRVPSAQVENKEQADRKQDSEEKQQLAVTTVPETRK